jgi:hypothetical protein
MSKSERVPGPYSQPRPITDTIGEGPNTIRQLLEELGFEIEVNDIVGTNQQKRAARQWVKKHREANLSRNLLAQMWLRQWLSDSEYDAHFPGRDRDCEVRVYTSSYNTAAND